MNFERKTPSVSLYKGGELKRMQITSVSPPVRGRIKEGGERVMLGVLHV